MKGTRWWENTARPSKMLNEKKPEYHNLIPTALPVLYV